MFYMFYISFLKTILLTQYLVVVVVFYVFLAFQKNSIKRSPNAMKLFNDFFRTKIKTWKLQGETRGHTRRWQANWARPGGGHVLMAWDYLPQPPDLTPPL